MIECYRIESSDYHVRGIIKRFCRECAWHAVVAAYSAVHASPKFPGAVSPSSVCVTLVQWYDPSIVQRRLNNRLPLGISPLLFRVQQPPLSQSGATTSNHGLRVPHLSKRRRDRRQRFGISERPFEHHKVSSS